MSRLIMWNLITLDGYFDGAVPWALDWHQYAWGEELEKHIIEQLRNADILLFGRATYDGMAAYWQKATGEVATLMNELPKAVVSRNIDRAEWNNTRLLKGDVPSEVRELKRQGQKNIFVFGSANLCATLVEERLFNEFRLCLVPVVLGSGKPLFGHSMNRLQLTLLEARPMSSGSVILRYEPHLGK